MNQEMSTLMNDKNVKTAFSFASERIKTKEKNLLKIVDDTREILSEFKNMTDKFYGYKHKNQRTVIQRDFLIKFISVLRDLKRELNVLEANLYIKLPSIELLSGNIMGDFLLVQSFCIKYMIGWDYDDEEQLFFFDEAPKKVEQEFNLFFYALDGIPDLIESINDAITNLANKPTIITDMTKDASLLRKIGILSYLKKIKKEKEKKEKEKTKKKKKKQKSLDEQNEDILLEDEELEELIEDEEKEEEKNKNIPIQIEDLGIDLINYHEPAGRSLMESYSLHRSDLPALCYNEKVIKINTNMNLQFIFEFLKSQNISLPLSFKELVEIQTMITDFFTIMDSFRNGKYNCIIHVNGKKVYQSIIDAAYYLVRRLRNKSDLLKYKFFILYENLAVSRPVLFQCLPVLNDYCNYFLGESIEMNKMVFNSNHLFRMKVIETTLCETQALIEIAYRYLKDLRFPSERVVFLSSSSCAICHSSKELGTTGFYDRKDIRSWIAILEKNNYTIDFFEWGDYRPGMMQWCWRYYCGGYISAIEEDGKWLPFQVLPCVIYGVTRVDGFNTGDQFSDPIKILEKELWGRAKGFLRKTKASTARGGKAPKEQKEIHQKLEAEYKEKKKENDYMVVTNTKKPERIIEALSDAIIKNGAFESLSKWAKAVGLSWTTVRNYLPKVEKELERKGYLLIVDNTASKWKRCEVIKQ